MKFAPALLILSLTTFSAYTAEVTDSYLPHISNIAELTDLNRQADAWATCSVIYDFYSEIVSSNETTATTELLKQQSNGAIMAILMSQLIGLEESASEEQFTATYKYGQHLMETLPSQKELQIKSELEMLSVQKKPVAPVTDRILNTFKVCQSSLSLQQAYIDLFRELAKSGMIQ